MPPADLVVYGGTVATEYGAFKATVVIREGRVVALTDPDDRGPDADEKIDAQGKLVIPGGVDAHCHFDEPAPWETREGFECGTRAAAAGGVTTVLEHPISVPPPKDAATFAAKRDLAGARSVTDFGLWGALIPESIEHIPEMHALGAVAFKAFMSEAGADYPMVDDGQLLAGMQQAAPLGAIVGVHAEGEALTSYYTRSLEVAGRRDPRAIAEGRPPIAELEAIQRAITLAQHAGARLHIVHMSIPEGADLIHAARQGGAMVTAETCPHYLHLDWETLDRLGAYAKCKPPLRSPDSTERLWQAVLSGKLDFIAADHAPYTRHEKEHGTVWDAPWGMPGIQTMLPILISDGLLKRNWDLSAFVRFTSTRCAEVFGISDRKGTLRVGADGDLVVIDPNGSWTVRSEDLFYKQGWSALEGETLDGCIEKTVIRGRIVYDRGEIKVAPGFGEFLMPRRSRAASETIARDGAVAVVAG
ncbi:MAG: allantoinase AllB [Chloroflexi bacterium]|nr:allantoinase AllB [Chloroflexota bacterium]